MRKRSVAAVAWLVAGAVGCGGADEAGDGTIRIGAIFDLSGPTADVGTDYAEGIQGYVKWLNERGGIEGRQLELIYQDYAYRIDRAEQLYAQFTQRGVVAFMGWGTGDTEALRGRITEDQIPFTSASLSHLLGDPAEAPYNFLFAPTYSDQFFILLDWIVRDHEARGGGGAGRPTVAFMHHASPFGLSPWNQGGRDYAATHGIEAAAYEMPRGATDFTAELTRIRQSGAQYIIFQNTSSPVALVLRNARSIGLNATFLCMSYCSNELLTELAGDAAEGAIGSMTFSPLHMDVPGIQEIRRYLESEGEAIEDKISAYPQGWWTMALMVEGIRRVVAAGQPLTGERIKAALESLSNFDTGGVTVPISFTADDHRGAKGMRLFRVEDGVWLPLTEVLTAPLAQ